MNLSERDLPQRIKWAHKGEPFRRRYNDIRFVDETFKIYDEGNLIPVEILNYAKQVMKNNLKEATDPSRRRKIKQKVTHTEQVIKATIEIVDTDTEAEELGIATNRTIEDVKKIGCIIALLHDIGRFPQIIEANTYSDITSQIDHGDLGEQMLINESIMSAGVSMEVLRAVRLHNKYQPDNLDFYDKLIRDADKLANMRYLWPPFSAEENLDDTGYTETVFHDLIEGRLAVNTQRKTKIDAILHLMSWFNDLNFNSTRRLLLESDFFTKCLADLSDLGLDKTKTAQVSAYVESLKTKYSQPNRQNN